MQKNRSLIVTAVMLLLSIINYSRIKGNENIRPIQFLSIFAIGILSGLLLRGIAERMRSK